MFEHSKNQGQPAPSHSPEQQPDDAFGELRAHSLKLADQFKVEALVGDIRALTEVAHKLAAEPDVFVHATPRLLTFLCDQDPELQRVTGDLLGQRSHWTGKEQLNELVLPCIKHVFRNKGASLAANSLIHGICLNGPDIAAEHIEHLSDLALKQYSTPSGPCIDLAVLSLLGEQIRVDDLWLVLTSEKFVLRKMSEAMRAGTDLAEIFGPNSERLFNGAVAGLFRMRTIIENLCQEGGEYGALAQEVLDEMRDFVEQMAELIERGEFPSAISGWLLLVTYPAIDPEHHIPSRLAAASIADCIQEAEPELANLIRDTFAQTLKSKMTLPQPPVDNHDVIGNLKIISGVTRFTRDVDNATVPPPVLSQAQLQLTRIVRETIHPLIALYAEEAQMRMLNQID